MCRIEDADGDGIWLQPLIERTAKKEHRCEDCGRTIAKGERYTYGLWKDDYLNTVKVCAHCVAAGRWLKVVCGGHLWPGVLEELKEHWDEEWELRSNGLAWLVSAGRSHWLRRGQLVPVELVSSWVDKALAKVPETARH